MTGSRRRDDAGQAGGWEIIPFGMLIFVVGSLLIVNAWAVVDARQSAGDAAREEARAFVHESDEAGARAAARDAVFASTDGRGTPRERVALAPIHLDPSFERCAHVVVTVREVVPAISLPFIGGFGHAFTVTGSQDELIDPFRADLPEASACAN